MIPEYIRRRIYPVNGSECQIWLGATRRIWGVLRPTYWHRDGTPTDVRILMYGDPKRLGFRWRTPVCGNGRCLGEAHQSTTAIGGGAE